MSQVKIFGIFDNETSEEDLVAGWGFSALISSSERALLFDAGSDVKILEENMEELGVIPGDLDGIFLSHPHCDHVGGLSAVLSQNSDLSVYVTKGFPQEIKNKVRDYGAELVEIAGSEEIFEGWHSTGEMISDYHGSDLPEQGLTVEGDSGPVVISGCAHPGISKIVGRAKEITGEPPRLVLGGFHLGSRSKGEIKAILKDFAGYGVRGVAPTHCTGEKAKAIMRVEYREDFVDFGVGEQIRV